MKGFKADLAGVRHGRKSGGSLLRYEEERVRPIGCSLVVTKEPITEKVLE